MQGSNGLFHPQSQCNNTPSQFASSINLIAQYKCQACGASFASQEELMEHSKVAHSSPQSQQQGQREDFECKACGKHFHSLAELQQHGKIAHPM
jgi:DNA-directed RNA polymerase subunit RPC12/RpoP